MPEYPLGMVVVALPSSPAFPVVRERRECLSRAGRQVERRKGMGRPGHCPAQEAVKSRDREQRDGGEPGRRTREPASPPCPAQGEWPSLFPLPPSREESREGPESSPSPRPPPHSQLPACLFHGREREEPAQSNARPEREGEGEGGRAHLLFPPAPAGKWPACPPCVLRGLRPESGPPAHCRLPREGLCVETVFHACSNVIPLGQIE